MFLKRNQAGSSLIETLIALFVLAVGLMGFAALLSNSLIMNQRAFTLSQAMMMANNYTERMRMNRSQAAAYAIDNNDEEAAAAVIENSDESSDSSSNCETTGCNAAEIADWDKKQWSELLQKTIPGAEAEVTVITDEGIIDVVVTLEYALRVGRVGKGDEASVTQMKKLVDNLSTFQLRTEI